MSQHSTPDKNHPSRALGWTTTDEESEDHVGATKPNGRSNSLEFAKELKFKYWFLMGLKVCDFRSIAKAFDIKQATIKNGLIANILQLVQLPLKREMSLSDLFSMDLTRPHFGLFSRRWPSLEEILPEPDWDNLENLLSRTIPGSRRLPAMTSHRISSAPVPSFSDGFPQSSGDSIPARSGNLNDTAGNALQSMSQTGTNGHNFLGNSEFGRHLVIIACDPKARNALLISGREVTRLELVANVSKDSFRSTVIAKKFNDPSWNDKLSFAGVAEGIRVDLAPPVRRDGQFLNEKNRKNRKGFNSFFRKWSRSGQLDPEGFPNFLPVYRGVISATEVRAHLTFSILRPAEWVRRATRFDSEADRSILFFKLRISMGKTEDTGGTSSMKRKRESLRK